MDFTINFAAINWLVVFGATVVAMLLGGLWYSPVLFGRFLNVGNGLNQNKERHRVNMPAIFIGAFVLQMIAASVLSALLGTNSTGQEGVQLGTIIALCFVITAMGMANLFEHRPISVMWVNASYHFVAYGLMGFIVGTWG